MQVSDSGSVRLLDSSLQILIPSDDPAVSSSVVQILIKSTQLGVLYNVGLTVFSSKVKNSSKSETKNQKFILLEQCEQYEQFIFEKSSSRANRCEHCSVEPAYERISKRHLFLRS